MEFIQIDLNAWATEKESAWQMCVGSGHAALALRKDCTNDVIMLNLQ